jgi:autotransporter-associated beta strand protein
MTPSAHLRALKRAFVSHSVVFTVCLLAPVSGMAQSAWLAAPGSANFNDPTNYSPAPNFSANPSLSFGLSGVSGVTVSAPVTLSGLTFVSGASAYTFSGTAAVSITNATTNAVVLANNSQTTQVFNNPLSVVGSANARWNAVSGDMVLAGGLVVNVANRSVFIGASTGRSFTISGPVTGVAGIIKGANGLAANQGTLVLSNAANSFAGTLTANAGPIVLLASGAEGAPGGNILVGNTAGADPAAILLGGAGVTVMRNITAQAGSAGVVRVGGAAGLLTGTGTFNGNITLGSGAQAKAVTLDVPTGTEIVYAGVIQDVAGLAAGFPSVTKIGAGTAVLMSANTFQGTLVVTEGSVRLAAAERLRDSVTVQVSGGTLALEGFSETIYGLQIGGGASLDFGSGASVLSLGSLTRSAGLLSVRNWSGSPTGGGTDRLVVATPPDGAVLASINFQGYSDGAMAIPHAGGGWEVVPAAVGGVAPSISQHPQSSVVPQGATLQLSVVAAGAAPLAYQWRRDSNNLTDGPGISGSGGATLTLASVAAGSSGLYDVVVSNSVGSITSNPAQLTVYGPPVITLQPASTVRDLGQSASFTVQVTSVGTVSYQWRKDGQPIAGATAPQLTLANVSAAQVGLYDVVVTNAAGSTTSSGASLALSNNPVAPIILTQPAGVVVAPDSSAVLTVNAIGTEPMSYQWRKNGVSVAGATTASLILNPVLPSSAGNYDVVVSNPHGSATSVAASVTLLAGPADAGSWRQMHPGGGGQVQGLTMDPNIPGRMYVCSDVEGAYRSDDWGLTWQPIGEDLIHHMSFHVAVTPGNSNVIYCGTLYGIHRSNDAGRTWQVILGGYANASWAFDPFDPTGRTWLAGRSWYIKSSQLPTQTADPSQETNGAYFIVRSTNAGDTVSQHAYQAGAGTNQVYTITYDPTRQGHVYIAGDAGLFRSRDGGVNWEPLSMPAGETFTRGADLTPDGKWIYATFGATGRLHVAAIDPNGTALTWANVHTDTALLTAAGGNYWRPLVDPRSSVAVEAGGLGAGEHRVLMGSFTSSANSNVGLVEGEFTDAGASIQVNSWGYAFRRAGTASGWNYEFGWNLIDPQCRQYAWTPRSWDGVQPPGHIVAIDATSRRSRILMASQQSVYTGGPDDPDSWSVLSSSYVRTQNTATGSADFFRTRGFSSTVNFDMDGWQSYYVQGMADNRVLESFDGGYSWSQDTIPPGGRVGNGDALHILRPRSSGEAPVSLVGTAPGAGGGADTAVGTLYRKVLNNLNGPTDSWANLGSLPLQGLSTAPRIWYIESLPLDNDLVFVGTQSGLYYTDSMRASAPVFTRVTGIPDSFKQGRILVDPISTKTNVTLYLKTSGSARVYVAVGTRASVTDPFSFTYTPISVNGTVRVVDDLYHWRRSADQREFMAHTNSAQELWIRERAAGEANWSTWTRVVNRAGILGVKQLPWIDWVGRGVDQASQTITSSQSAAPDAFTVSGLGGFENSLVAAAWVEDGKHGYAMLKLDRVDAGQWTLSDWTGTPVAGSFDYQMGVARVWRSKVVAVTADRNEYLTASRGGGLWARALAQVSPVPTVTGPTEAVGQVGQPFSLQLQASNSPIDFTAIGLPEGLTLNATTGVISGVPLVGQVTTVTVTARNATGTSAAAILTLTIARAPQTITFAALTDKTFGAGPVALVAEASSGLPVEFTVISGPAVVAGNSLTLTGTGLVSVAAQQPGNPSYLSATQVQRDFLVLAAVAGVNFGPLQFTYDGTPKSVAVSTTPAGLPVTLTYDGAASAPVAAGSYTVAAVVNHQNYTGSATGTMTIQRADAPVTVTGLYQAYDGTPKPVTVSTAPTGLTVQIKYDGKAEAPFLPGSYEVVVIVEDSNYAGTLTETLTITIPALVRHGGALSGVIDGSLQILLPEDFTLNGQGGIGGDLLVPGTPAVVRNGQAQFPVLVNGGGSDAPSAHKITINGQSTLTRLATRVDPIEMPAAPVPAATTGTRDVTLNGAGQALGEPATLRDLTLNGNAGLVTLPPGTYRTIVANGNSGLVLGTAGASEPAVYQLQELVLNGKAELRINGPVLLILAKTLVLGVSAGSTEDPLLLTITASEGGVTLNGNSTLNARVVAPQGTVTLSGGSTLRGEVAADRLILNGNSRLLAH